MLVVGFEPLHGSFPVVVRSLPAVVVVTGGGIGSFLGISCHSSGLGMTVRYLGSLQSSLVGPSAWLVHVVL